MATSATNDIDLTYAILCPPPLAIQKKPRRATFRRRILQRSVPSESHDQYVFGPLDDIIDVIKSNIWESPPDHSFAESVVEWEKLPTAPSMWTMTPLPLSHMPSDQPLTIHKNRNSRSSASDSSMSDPMTRWRKGSQDEGLRGGPVGPLPWPPLDPMVSHESTSAPQPSDRTSGSERPTAQQALQDVVHNGAHRSDATRRRPSRLRFFTNGFPRRRRMGTGDTGASADDTSTALSSSVEDTLAPHSPVYEGAEEREPSDEAVESYIRNNTKDGTRLERIIDRLEKRLPYLAECEPEQLDALVPYISSELPTTLRTAVRVFAEKKVLTEGIEEMDIAINIEGVLHNRKPRRDGSVDVIIVVDNGYYVTRSCLEKALDAANGTLYHLVRGDRLALYTTHCTHKEVTGNRPDRHYPLCPFANDVEDIFRDLITGIAHHGTQGWKPPRPNPSMTDVILGIMRSLEDQGLKKRRTHILLLSPAPCVLHDMSKCFPDVFIHRINSAILPYRREPEPQDAVCRESCCKNVFSSNWSSQESVANRIKRILKNARSEAPVGEVTDLSIDLRARDGCEIVRCDISRDGTQLRLGQVHTFFARIRVTKAMTRAVDMESKNPVFNSSLDATGSRRDLQNAIIRGATKVHLLDVQVLYRNSINISDSWNYTETPLLLFTHLGSLSIPSDQSMEVYKRHYFHLVNQGTLHAAKTTASTLRSRVPEQHRFATDLLDRMLKELVAHEAIRAYEDTFRQRLPLCPGPIDIETSAHDWLVELWSRQRSRRRGVAGVDGKGIGELVLGVDGL